jgi:protoheme IX farnesyltransferase
MGLVYLLAAIGLGVVFIARAAGLRRKPTAAAAMALFHFSIAYLALLFGAVALDALVHVRL